MGSIGGIRAALLAVLGLAMLVGQAMAEKRVALVIGNAAYKESPLKNPVNDARLMGQRLKALGFDVIQRENATRDQMGSAVVEFARKLTPDTAALIYYAGHGIQARGRNYMIPVDAALGTEFDLRFQAVDVGVLTEAIEQAQSRISFLILDACRNNPFERRMRGSPQGLAAVDAARGALIAYATAPGSVAADGDGQNGTYTEELAKVLAVPNLKAEEVFKRVTAAVEERTKGQQTPWISSSLRGDFVFNVSVNVASAPAATGAAVDRETVFWQSIQASTRSADFDAYLTQFPQGTFAALARIRLADLKGGAQLAAAPAKPDAAPKPDIAIDPIDKPYVATSSARLRDAPDLKAGVVATLKEGDNVHVLGKVKGQNWYQVERKGQAPGYVASSLLQDAVQPREAPVQQAMAPPKRPTASAAPPPLDHDGILRRVADLAMRTADSLPADMEDDDVARALSRLGGVLCFAGSMQGARALFARAESEADGIDRTYDATWLRASELAGLAEVQAECGDQAWQRSADRAISTGAGIPGPDSLDYRYLKPTDAMLVAGEFERAIAYVDRSGNAKLRAQVRDRAAGKFAYKEARLLADGDRQRAVRWAQDGATLAGGICGTDAGWVCQSLGTKLARLGDTQGAERVLDRLTKPDWRVGLRIEIAQALGKAGDVARAAANLAEALAQSRAIDSQYGNDDQQRSAIAGGYARLGDLAAVDRVLQQIVRSDKREWGYSNVASALTERGQWADAARYAERQSSPARAASSLAWLGKKQRDDGDAAGALQNWERAAALAERETDPEQHAYLVWPAKLFRDAGEQGLASRVLGCARQLAEALTDPSKRKAVGTYAGSYALAGDPDFALRAIEFMVMPKDRAWPLYYMAKNIVEAKRDNPAGTKP